ncbi:MAG TPA: hypothetical protein VFA10_15600 [Ktedonobacteraceae bacterium]|jgi:hypothetical protein|nr:hypothetical protein [Ktedonobacteraceae bacterium]
MLLSRPTASLACWWLEYADGAWTMDAQHQALQHAEQVVQISAFKILYPCLRVVPGKVKIESVGSLPPTFISPLSMKPLDVKIQSHLSPFVASKGQSLTNFTSQLAVDSF